MLDFQAHRLLMALGDVFPADAKIALLERLAALHPDPNARVILGQSGADAVTAALKSALLFTGKPGVIAFAGAYHGLSHAPLAACGLRESYRAPFAEQLNPHVEFVDYPTRASRSRPSAEPSPRRAFGRHGRRDLGRADLGPWRCGRAASRVFAGARQFGA